MAERLEAPPIREPLSYRSPDLFTSTWSRWLDALWRAQQATGTGGGGGPFQPLDPLLTALAALVTSADTLAYFTGPDTVALTTLTAYMRTLLNDPDAATARGTLDVPQAATVQPLDATLTALASLATLADRLPYFTGVDTATLTVLTAFARTLLDDPDAATMRGTLGVPATGTVQPLDATLSALAGLATGADQLPYATGTDTFAQTALTALARTLLGNATTGAMQTTLGLGTAATQAYTEGTATVTGTGFSGTAPSGTARYAQVGTLVTLFIPALSGTSNATTFTLTGIPAGILPARTHEQVVYVTDNSVLSYGDAFLTTGGLSFFFGAGLAFTASGTKGVRAVCLAYNRL